MSDQETGMNVQSDGLAGQESEAYHQLMKLDRSVREKDLNFLEKRWGENI